MALSPICLVRDGGGPFVSTTGGVDVTPGALIGIKLDSTTDVVNWYLEVVGTDELSTVPVLAGVNPVTHQVTTPSTVVTFTFPAVQGRAIGFKSTVTGTGGPIQTTFGTYTLTAFTTRVGFVTETREGDVDFGWAVKLNPLIRSGGGGGGGGYSLEEITERKVVPSQQGMVYTEDVKILDGGNLDLEGEVTPAWSVDNFSVEYVPPRSTRVVQENDIMLFTDSLDIDGTLIVDGDTLEATPYDGYDIVSAFETSFPGNTWVDAVLNTTSATATTIYSYATTANRHVIAFDLLIEAQANASGNIALFKITAACYRANGPFTVVIKDVNFLNGPYKDAGAVAWNVTFDAPFGGPVINVNVAGDTGVSIDWRVSGRIVEYG